MKSHTTSATLIATLRKNLRREGWTIARLAEELGVGKATVKRWLVGQGLSLDRLDQLAGLLGMTVGDLAYLSENQREGLATELTLAQERALSANVFLSFLFSALLNGIAPDDIARDAGVPPRTMEAALIRLERLALIDRLRSGRIRVRVDRRLVFRKVPLRRMFDTYVKSAYFELDYGAPETRYIADLQRLSSVGAARLAELIERFRLEVQELADEDRKSAALEASWYGVLAVMRGFDLTPFRGMAVSDFREGSDAEIVNLAKRAQEAQGEERR